MRSKIRKYNNYKNNHHTEYLFFKLKDLKKDEHPLKYSLYHFYEHLRDKFVHVHNSVHTLKKQTDDTKNLLERLNVLLHKIKRSKKS